MAFSAGAGLLPSALQGVQFVQKPVDAAPSPVHAAPDRDKPAPSPRRDQDDRLLGGLLSPAFDDYSCRSRYASPSLYRRPSPFRPSSHLVARLRRYEARHRRCGPGSPLFGEAVEHLRSGRNAARSECQYTVWTPFNGLGNRMLALASTFLHALLTDRVLLVHAPHEFDGLFCEPFPGSSWTLPAGFPIADFDGTFTMLSPTSYKNMKKAGTINGGENPNVTAETLPAYVFLDLIQSYTGAAFCEADQRVLAKFNWMVVKSDVYFATAFFLMPVYRRELARLFPEKEAAFHHLARYLFHPSNDVWAIVREFHEAYLAGADERIGLQVRVFPELPVPFETMYGQIMRCSEQEGLLPKVAERNAAAARNTSAVSSPDGRKTKLTSILVTSLSPEYYERIRGVYQANRAETGGYVAVHQPSHDGVQHTEARGHNQRALAEIYLLSFCDRIVTTAVSTFGQPHQIGQGLTSKFLGLRYPNSAEYMIQIAQTKMLWKLRRFKQQQATKTTWFRDNDEVVEITLDASACGGCVADTRKRYNRSKSNAAVALKGSQFVTAKVADDGTADVEKSFNHLHVDGVLLRSRFGKCIGR
uniref:Fucosyltransferase n=1 Tax=Aegilops tauschii TaxID=37682 RepID=N1R4X1_AEGTA